MIPMTRTVNAKLKKMRRPASIIYTKSCSGLWKDSEAAAMLVPLLAAPRDQLAEVEKVFDITPSKVKDMPSASLAEAFKVAKVNAQEKERSTTVIVVLLVDLYMLELEEMGLEDQCTGFGHNFVLGVGPEGVIVWQGTPSCAFDMYLAQAGASVRNWQQAEEFVKDFGKLTDGRKVC